MKKKIDKTKFDNSWYKPGSLVKRILWMVLNPIFVNNNFFPFLAVKIALLRLFGAKIGNRVVIKSGVNIKYPWFLEIGNYVGIGENVWIDNLAKVTIGDQVTISQGVYLLTGNHDYTSVSFALMIDKIIIEEGAWIGAKSIVCPGVTCKSHSVVGVGSVLKNDTDPYGIYFGIPAKKVKTREIK